ncbi:biotin transporter BioY [Methanococcoides methylutens]|uniref:Substrate-specific component BioY of biotin ECF transporter n=1 Tax=Methanococcoides methylutens MM1 TaxID=1434104 RepID=A0A0E3WYJ9_METMT|nr:biotin transporter BioY [Methanococcoides methylutens]AKB84239.1 Substrate-specific component BioY of biotin ECF transporter [Methanococcoides methylutens MM1]
MVNKDTISIHKAPLSSSSDIKKMVYASLFAALTAIGAYITIPLGPIPFTLQVVFVLLAGGMLGSKWGPISMIVYTLLGIAGLPVFSGGASGIGVILGPTGGYIIGFIAAAFVVGFLFENKRTEKLLINALYVLAGSAVIYAFGLTHLMIVADMSFIQAVTVGFLPFIGGALVKVAVAAYIATKYRI